MKKKLILCLFIFIILILVGLYELYTNKINKFNEVEIEISENNENKALVYDEKTFIEALKNTKIQIIEIQYDIDLGYNFISSQGIVSDVVEKHSEPLTHPKLKETGVSKLKIINRDGLIIYSKSGNKILHTNIVLDNSKNIKLYNLKFEELWEWDEDTKAEFDRNNWDYISIKNSENICIKNCEFSKAYDGITDMDNCKNVTIEYCKLNETDLEKDEFFNIQFQELENNIDKYKMYKFLRKDIGLDINKIKKLCSYQFKLYLIGTKDGCARNENIIIHDNMFLKIKTRIPFARNSSVYLYNNYIDQSDMNIDNIIDVNQLKLIKEKYPKIVSLSTHGVISTQKAYVLLDNNYYKDVKHKYTNYINNQILDRGRIKVKSEAKDELKDKLLKVVGCKKEE